MVSVKNGAATELRVILVVYLYRPLVPIYYPGRMDDLVGQGRGSKHRPVLRSAPLVTAPQTPNCRSILVQIALRPTHTFSDRSLVKSLTLELDPVNYSWMILYNLCKKVSLLT